MSYSHTARSRRNSHTRQLTRRHRLLQAERLEDRQLLATITGTVFNDLNADGVKNTGESGQSGWTIFLDTDGNGQLDTGETSTTTAANGSYTFSGLAAGTYNVREDLQLGWRQTSPVGSVPGIERVSITTDGMEGNGASSPYALSADGRFVAFFSDASNLVPGDTNGVRDVFVYDQQTDTIERVSVATDGTEGNGLSSGPTLSADGRYVVFSSSADNLVASDTNGVSDTFVYDRQLHTIERISVATDGTQGDGKSSLGSLSADGRYVAFSSSAGNLVPGDTNGETDIFVYDRQTHSIECVTRTPDGTQGNGDSTLARISADGRYVTFSSGANNLVPGDTNDTPDLIGYDIFVHDRLTHSTERVSVASDGTQANGQSLQPTISADGRFVEFVSFASNLVAGDTNARHDIFVHDLQTNTTERVSLAADGTQANNTSIGYGSISADGRYVAFVSMAINLVPGDTNYPVAFDVFVYDRQTDDIRRVNLAADGTQANSNSGNISISADGRYLAFYSAASNLVPGDTNGVDDVFITPNPFAPVPGSRVVTVADGQAVSGADFGNTSLATKFYVVNDLTVDRTYEYNPTGTAVETYVLNTGNTAPRGAASTIAGDKTWVVDANRKVYVYNNSGALLGSWTAGTLSTTAMVEGIATNGTDVWIVDAKSDKVYKYTGAASRLSGSQNAASSFSLNSSNTSPKDIVTDGVNLWVVNNSTTDKVFKYTVAGSLVSSWTISTAGATSPTGITLDPANVSNLWIVDNGNDRVYQYNAAATFANGSSHAADVAFALAAGNTNPQGIADPPAPGTYLVNDSTAAATIANDVDAALENLYYEPVRQMPATRHTRSEASSVAPRGDLLVRSADADYTIGAAASRVSIDSRISRDHHGDAERDGLFAQWDSDPLGLVSLPDLGM